MIVLAWALSALSFMCFMAAALADETPLAWWFAGAGSFALAYWVWP